MPENLIIFDCDSTLSAIEGVDELGALRDKDTRDEVAALTDKAMAGDIPIVEVFGHRMSLIRPTRQECKDIGQRYIEEIEPGATELIGSLRKRGWEAAILSGGFVPCITPLAEHLGITYLEAVPLIFDGEGDYIGFDEEYPTTRNGGKPEVVRKLKTALSPLKTVMVGDGVSDLETKPVVDFFIGFGRYAERARVKEEADFFIHELAQIPGILDQA